MSSLPDSLPSDSSDGLDQNIWGRLFATPQPLLGVEPWQLGYRMCNIVEGEGHLDLVGIGAGHNYRWQPGINVAVCNGGLHPAPNSRCTCGLYGLHSLSQVLHVVGPDGGDILAGVIASGAIEYHEFGFKAQEAELVVISSQLIGRMIKRPDGTPIRWTYRQVADLSTLRALGAYYRVPVVSLEELPIALNAALVERSR